MNASFQGGAIYGSIRKLRTLSRFLVAGFLLLSMVGYFFYQAHDFILGPSLNLASPSDGEVLRNEDVFIKGKTDPGSSLTVNGANIYSDPVGNFSYELLLAKGLHVLEVVARDRFGKEKKIIRQIVVE